MSSVKKIETEMHVKMHGSGPQVSVKQCVMSMGYSEEETLSLIGQHRILASLGPIDSYVRRGVQLYVIDSPEILEESSTQLDRGYLIDLE